MNGKHKKDMSGWIGLEIICEIIGLIFDVFD